MIGYVTLGSTDMNRSLAFYDGLFAAIGGKRLMQMPDARQLTFYGSGGGTPMVGIGLPYDGETAGTGNGAMVALGMDSREQVEVAHAKAIDLGGTDEGAPGPRGPEAMNLYAAYFRDPDGNKFCVIKMG